MGKEISSLRMDFLETFIAVCELKSFSKAAEKLQKSQGGISQQITQLEEYFAAKLINRTSREFSLTEEGEILFEKAQEIITLLNQTRNEILEKSKKLGGTVKICASSTPGEHIIPRFIAEFRARNPHVEFHVNIANSGICLKKLQNREYDIIAVGSLMEIKDMSNFDLHTIAEEEIVVICSQSHPILKIGKYVPNSARYHIPNAEFEKYGFIVREKQSGTQKEFEKQFGKPLKVVLELNNPQSIITAVQNSEMLGIMSAFVAKKAEAAGLISIVESGESAPLKRKIILIRLKDEKGGEAVRKFWEYISQHPFEFGVDL